MFNILPFPWDQVLKIAMGVSKYDCCLCSMYVQYIFYFLCTRSSYTTPTVHTYLFSILWSMCDIAESIFVLSVSTSMVSWSLCYVHGLFPCFYSFWGLWYVAIKLFSVIQPPYNYTFTKSWPLCISMYYSTWILYLLLYSSSQCNQGLLLYS